MHAIKSLARTRGLTTTVVVTLALAIGASTLIFSVVNGVLLEPLPFAHADRTVAVTSPVTGTLVSPLDFLDLRRQARGLDASAVYFVSTATITSTSEPLRVAVADVSADWFSLLGAPVEYGRAFATDDDTPRAPKTVVLSDAFWRAHLGADEHAVGHSITIDGEVHTIVGIATPRFTFPGRTDVWRPLVMAPWMLAPKIRSAHMLSMIGRRATGTSLDAASHELGALTERLRIEYGSAPSSLHYGLVPLKQQIVRDARPALVMLLAAVGCLLAIACANVANLLLVRATARSTELGIRVALGASQGRVIRQMLSESVALSVIGGALGVLLAYGGLHALVAAHLSQLPRLDDITINGRVLVFSTVLAILTGVLFGLAPALHSSRLDPMRALKVRLGGGGGPRAGRLRATLVVTETAVAVVLLIGAGLVARGFARLTTIDPGLRPERVTRFSVSLPYTERAKLREFTDGAIRALNALPGTASSAAGFGLPFSQRVGSESVHIAGHPDADGTQAPFAWMRFVTPGAFPTLGLTLQRGRAFTDDDRAGAKPVVLVSAAFARAYFPGEDPIGQSLSTDWTTDSGAVGGEIVGVVGDTKANDLTAVPSPVVYVPFDQQPVGDLTFVVRSSANPSTVLAAAHRIVSGLDPQVPLYETGTLAAAIGGTVATPRLYSTVMNAFAGAALLLVVLGIYGVLAYNIRLRRREMGIRMALGAAAAQVHALVIGQGLRLMGLGLAIGIPIAAALSRLLANLLYGVSPHDGITYASVAGALLIVAALASWLPARRAAAISPTVAMQSE